MIKKFFIKYLSATLLTVVTLTTFSVFYFNSSDDFVDFDDNRSVCENHSVLTAPTLPSLKMAFSTFSADGNYDPLVQLSYMMDYKLYGFNRTHVQVPTSNPQLAANIFAVSQPDYTGAYGYHLKSILLHCISVVLIFFLFSQLSGSVWIGAIVSLLFGIHPMHIESIAWISERKDQLYAVFYFAALLAYLQYIKVQPPGRTKFLFLTGLFFLLSLLSKGEAVTLPLVLLLIDYYKGIKIDLKNILLKIPFFLTALLFGIVAIYAEKSINSFENPDVYLPFTDRIFVACFALVTYLWKLIVPIHLSAFYPYPLKTNGLYPLGIYLCTLIVIGLCFFVWLFRKNKAIVFGSLFFLINIFLVIQLLPVGDAVVAERYTYVPYIGLFFMLAVVITSYFQNKNGISLLYKIKPLIAFIGAVYLLFILWSAQKQAKTWQNSKNLWQSAYKSFPTAERVSGNMAMVYLSELNVDSALYYLDATIQLHSIEAYLIRAAVYTAIGKLDEGFVDCNRVINARSKVDPSKLVEAYVDRAHIYAIKNQLDSALDDCNKAITCKGTAATLGLAYRDRLTVLTTYFLRGIQYCKTGDYQHAISDFRQILPYQNSDTVYYDKGFAEASLKQYDSAITDFTRAIELKPQAADYYFARSNAKYNLKDYTGAITDNNSGLAYRPNDPNALFNRGLAKFFMDDKNGACTDWLLAQQAGNPNAPLAIQKYCK